MLSKGSKESMLRSSLVGRQATTSHDEAIQEIDFEEEEKVEDYEGEDLYSCENLSKV